ncbi:MAG: PDZ domain-containing protein [Verrucomicrobiaceae bacterium]|nr:PDZ domain-containing protein [Verrucomicrobiaceae bacterium]
MNIQSLLAAAGWICLSCHGIAQYTVTMPDPFAGLSWHEKRELKNQASGFFSASKPVVAEAAKSTVSIYHQGGRICYGTVVMSGSSPQPLILTKWSEIKKASNRLVVMTSEGKAFAATIAGVYPDHDLALLDYDVNDAELTPLDLSQAAPLTLGSFILMANPDGSVESLGVVSVESRSLRDMDKAYLGVMMDPVKEQEGIALREIMPGSAAAKAGLRAGDIILAVDKEDMTGLMEMKTLLQRLQPGSEIIVSYKRGNVRKKTKVELGSLSENPTIPRFPQKRMDIMERMGAIRSDIRTNFPSVVQSDMPIYPTDTGAPITDLDGKIAGIAIARGSRIKTYIIPTSTIKKLLTKAPQTISHVQAELAKRGVTESNSQAENPLELVRRLLGKPNGTRYNREENMRKIQEALEKLPPRRKNEP